MNCNSNNLCGFSGNNWWWILILLLLCSGSFGFGNQNDCC